MDDKIAKLREIIAGSDNIVFFGGAGVSTESGIPDFRSVDGLYNQKYKYPPERILSHEFFEDNPEEFYKFCREKLFVTSVKPNKAHLRLAGLEREGKLRAVVTQNIDGLHQGAGSKNVLELHGTTHRFYCTHCGKEMSEEEACKSTGVPRCSCGGVIRPDVVLYGEGLNERVITESIMYISQCDVLIVGGTSLNVYPAAGLINYYRGQKLVLINKQATPYDSNADLIIHDKIGEVLEQV